MAPAVLGAIALKARHSCSGVCLFTTSTDNEMADGFLLYIGAVIRSSDMGRRSLRPWIELVFETLAEGAANALKPTQPRQRAKRTSDEAEKENSRKRVKGTGRPKSVLPEATASPLSDSTNASTPAPVSEAPRKVAKASVPVASKV
ncbi:hypothetical protein C8R44DRAFT_211807 [Mycena epipterygia]|nr:hypothetical protein C8R44DRAFT_211807 [Mycena epipterygia]